MNFAKMWKVVPEGEQGSFRIEHMEVDRKASHRTALRGAMAYVPPGKYCGLLHGGPRGSWDSTTWMSDTPMEQHSNYEIVRDAIGHVLVVGLGIGMVAHSLCRKRQVKSVTALELYPEVVRLVEPHIQHKKLRVILADGNEPPFRGRPFDSIYLDIWPDICSDNWTTMKPLLAKYRKLRRNGGIVTGWLKDYVQREHTKERYYL